MNDYWPISRLRRRGCPSDGGPSWRRGRCAAVFAVLLVAGCVPSTPMPATTAIFAGEQRVTVTLTGARNWTATGVFPAGTFDARQGEDKFLEHLDGAVVLQGDGYTLELSGKVDRRFGGENGSVKVANPAEGRQAVATLVGARSIPVISDASGSTVTISANSYSVHRWKLVTTTIRLEISDAATAPAESAPPCPPAATMCSTGTIPNGGGSVRLPDVAAVTSPAGAFPNSQVLRIWAHRDPVDANIFEATGYPFVAGSQLPYDVHVHSGSRQPKAPTRVDIDVPESYRSGLDPGTKLGILYKVHWQNDLETNDVFELIGDPADSTATKVTVELPDWAFGEVADGVEAVVTLAPFPAGFLTPNPAGGRAAAVEAPLCTLPEAPVASGYGARTRKGKTEFHDGIDYKMASGTDVVAAQEGTAHVKNDSGDATGKTGFGFYVYVVGTDGTVTIYGHMEDEGRVAGKVTHGAKLGKSDNSGLSSGPHLHFEVKDKDGKRIDPESRCKPPEPPPSPPKSCTPGPPAGPPPPPPPPPPTPPSSTIPAAVRAGVIGRPVAGRAVAPLTKLASADGRSPSCFRNWADPHIHGADGLNYNFQAVGEFIGAKSSVDDLELQLRDQPYGGSRTVANTTAVGARVAGTRIGIYLGVSQPEVYADGVRLPDGRWSLPGGGIVEVGVPASTGEYEVGSKEDSLTWPDGTWVTVQQRGGRFLDISGAFAAPRIGTISGLLGNANGDPADDLTSRDGTTLPIEGTSFSDLYQKFGNSWRISQAESLFDYKAGQTTATFTDLTFPDDWPSISAPARLAAEATCRASGVVVDFFLEACITDVAMAEDPEVAAAFVLSSAAAQNTSSDVFPIAVGDTVSPGSPPTAGSISRPGQHQRYLFQATAGQSIFLRTNQCGYQLRWQLLVPGATVGSPISMCEHLGRIDITTTGTYQVDVSGPGGTEAGAYGFSVLAIPVDSVFNISIPATVGPGSPPGAGNIGVLGQRQSFVFAGSAGQTITIKPDKTVCTAGLYFGVLDPSDHPIGLSPVCGDPGSIVLPTTGSYRILVGPTAYAAYTGTYGFTLTSP